MVGLDVGIQTGGQPRNKPLIIVNSVGLVVMAIWGWLAYRAVKHEDRALAWILTILLPAMYILPVVDIVLGGCCQVGFVHGCDAYACRCLCPQAVCLPCTVHVLCLGLEQTSTGLLLQCPGFATKCQ